MSPKNSLFLSLLLSGWLLSGCEATGDCFKSNGKTIEKTFEMNGISEIHLHDNIHLTIEPADTEKIIVTAGKNIMGKIEVRQDGNVIHLENNNTCNWVRDLSTMIHVHLYTSLLEKINYFGYGDIKTLSPIDYTDEFRLTIYHGYGNIDMEFYTQRVIVTYSQGAADMTLRGMTDYFGIITGTMGPVKAENLVANHVLVNHFGPADVSVHATERLDVELRSSGNIYFRGDPAINILRQPGTGQLIPIP